MKISRSEKNSERLYYGCDYRCGFTSWYAPVNDVRGYVEMKTNYDGLGSNKIRLMFDIRIKGRN